MNHQKRITKSLKRKLLLPIFSLGFVLAGLTVFIAHAKFQELLIEKLALRADLVANTVNYAAEGLSRVGELQRIVTSLGAEREINMVLVVIDTEPPKIIATNKGVLLGESLTYLNDAEISIHIQESLKTQLKYQHFDKHTSRYEIVLPLIMSQPKMLNEKSLTNAVVFVQFDSKPTEIEALHTVLEFTLSIFGLLTIAIAQNYYLLKHYVLTPVTKITQEVNVEKIDILAPSDSSEEYDEINILQETLHESLWSSNKAQQILEIQKIELQKNRDQFAALVTNIPGMTFRCAFDANCTMLFISGLVEELTGYPESDFIENSVRTYASIIHTDDYNFVNTQIGKAIKNNQPYIIEYRVIHRTGKIIWVHERGRAVEHQSGDICFIDGFILDISEKKQMELTLAASEFRWKFAVEGSGDGLWDWNVKTSEVFFSKKWKTMLGFAENEIEIENVLEEWAKRIHPNDVPQVMSDIQNYLDGRSETYANEHRVLCKDGSYKWILDRGIIVNRDENGKPLRLIGTHTDITERKNAEQIILEAKVAAESLAKSKSEFLANMSHEIRTPMTAIIGLSQLSLNKEMPDNVRDSLTKIYQSSNSLLGILNDILDFSKLDVGKLALEKSAFSLVTVLRNLHNLFSVSAKSKNLGFSISVEHDVTNELIGDALRIQQILSNLLGNAIKFTEHGKIGLRIKQIENRVNETVLRFSVEDTGIGIKVEHQDNLFKPFHQADNSITRRFGGTGLGLTISRDLLRLMDSDFHIDSVEGKGTTIYFDLLFKIPNPKMSKQSVSVPSNQQGTLQEKLSEMSKSLVGIKILLAEDNFLNQEIVSGFLKMSGIEVDIADNGIIALELLKLNVYDAILMDVHMPEMDGLQATKAIREQLKYAELPIIALTAGITTEEQEKCLFAGMNNLVEKPINPEVLLQTLSRCLKF